MNPPKTQSIRVSELNRQALEPGFPASLSPAAVLNETLAPEPESFQLRSTDPTPKRSQSTASFASPQVSPTSRLPHGLASASLAEIEAAFADQSTAELIAPIRPTKSEVIRRAKTVSIAPPEATRIWGIEYHCVTMQSALAYVEQLIERRLPSYVITSNLNYSMLCEKNPRLAEFTRRASLVLCDGMPILWRSLFNKKPLPARVAGADLIYQLAELCAQRGYRVYLYGAAEGVAQRTAEVLCSKYPKLKIAGVQCPPFHASSKAEIQAGVDRIHASNPDVLLVALGQPKGEYWIDDHLEQLDVPVSIQVGASFDFVAGIAVRAPRIWQRIGMEWLYRMLRDPKRLAPRYAKNFYYLCKSIRREMIDALS